MNIPVRWAYLAVFIAVFGHASSEFFAVLPGISGPEVSVWRFLIGGAGLVLWALSRADSRDLLTPLREEGWPLVGFTMLGVTLPYLAFHWALDFASVIQVATFVTTMPIWVGLTNLWLNKQPFTMAKIATGGVALLGIALLLTDGALGALKGDGNALFGMFLVIVCAAFGSAYAVIIKPVVARHGALRITALTMMMGGVGLWLTVGAAFGVWVDPSTLFARPASAATQGINPGWWLLVLGLWNTTITQLLWFGGLAAAPDITRASYLFFLKPVIAAVLAIFVLSQHPTMLQSLAILVVTGSVLVEMFWPRIERLLGRGAA
ncbi:MAG: DMT family transporter [Proteobacteria bacterium]|nr:DMT family transporter [Pseudomonadota bacterium]